MQRNKTNRKTSRRRSGRGKNSFFRRLPTWAWWIGGSAFAAFYVFLFYYFFVGPFSFRWKAIYGNSTYPSGYSIHGIDISHHQGTIKWQKLRNATIDGFPVRFVFIKATEGNFLLDENFNDNFYQAKNNDFIRGVYHFFSPSIPARKQAEYFLKQVHLEEGDFPPVLDIEHIGKQSPEEIKLSALTWLRIVEKKYKVKPIIYTNYDFKKKYLGDKVFDDYPYWIAHYYVDTIKYKGNWRFWQHTDVGKLDGIKGYVDLNIYNGSMYDLQRFTIGHKEEYGTEDYNEE